ncbi:MAG TPA: hypothetical protein VJ276_17335 [Thermoanaerobaculia bacterium]|nr:hypothetical protein [Thermoanaerobaculia bacterium]
MHAAGFLLYAASAVAVATQPLRTELSAEEAARMTRVKHEVRDAVAAALDAEPEPLLAQRRFTEAARAFEGVEVAFASVPSHPELVAVRTTVDIPCGGDNSLYLFRRDGDRWRLIFARESGPYRTTSGALDMFDYAVSPADADGRFFVVTANVVPSCNGLWHLLRYDVRRVNEHDPYASRVLFSASHTIYLDDAYALEAGGEDFRIRWRAEQSLDLGRHSRDYVRHYSVRADRVERIEPFALAPEAFVDEWGQMPWEEAARFGGMRAAHELLNRRRFVWSSFDTVTRKDDGAWIVPLQLERKPKDERMTFTLRQEGEAFRIEAIERGPGQ